MKGVFCFVPVEGFHDFSDLFEGDDFKVEDWVRWWSLFYFFFFWWWGRVWWDFEAGLVSYGDEEVIESVGYGLGLCVCLLLVGDLCWGGSWFRARRDDGFEDFGLFFGVAFAGI